MQCALQRCGLALLVAMLAATVAYASPQHPTALEVFRELPATIFENTPEGLSEGEKLQLTEQGTTDYWAIITDTPDELVLASLPFLESRVTVRIFRAEKGRTVAIIGTANGAACAIEVWMLESGGRLVPVGGPDEPPIEDFLAQGRTLPKGIDPSIMICLEQSVLEAKPLFWTATGLADVPLDNKVQFIWNGSTFEKTIRPIGHNATK